ncbi:MAG: CpsD/CapB family tyrosine-protein kinase [Oscillospiraceae bacterium]|nr:CpsD/CapB family tyrosine-protein kinase [Oscillospiraceae bacterium]
MAKSKAEKSSSTARREFVLSETTPFAIKEAYKTARTNLVFSLASSDAKIVVVSSCAPSEGKSTNCLNLAIAMAETGASVLLIDSDLRKPVQHTMLLLENKTGLSTLLAGISDDFSEIVNKDVYPKLDVLTSGSIPPNPAELIQSARMDKLLENVGKHYDYIFIDTPPVNVVTDALLYSGRVSGIVFIVRENHTTHVEINEAMKKASMTNAKILGFLKVGCSAGEKMGTGYKYKYKYKYNYYKYKDYSTTDHSDARSS